jgi:hypothetical protein
MDNMDTKKFQNKNQKYYCKLCDYGTSRKSQWDRHQTTQKHISVTMDNKKVPKSSKAFHCECGKSFAYNTGLCKHKKKCAEKKELKNEKKNNFHIENTENEDIIMTLVNENKKLMETIKTMAPKIGNNQNNSINIQVFLNEKCKDAINLTDFIQSLQITLDDINVSKNYGLVEGISQTMIKGLQNLDLYKRPFHCTDTKRDVLYIKDNEHWEKDESNNLMKDSILLVANKQRKALNQWMEANPGWKTNDKKQEEYIALISTLMESVENDEKGEKKIIKNISKEVQLNKDDLQIVE